MKLNALRRLAFALVLIFTPLPAHAGDGVLEINHTCATTTGCFAGDTAGYPVTIDGAAGRSYLLTSDLKLPLNTTGIAIQTSFVRLDLNGFAVVRECLFNNTAGGSEFCQVGTGGDGIVATAIGNDLNEVANGTVAGVAGAGVELRERSVVRNVRVMNVGGSGIRLDDSGLVEGCLVENAGSIGINARGVIRNNVVLSPGGPGINVNGSSTITGNHVKESGTTGITASASTIRGNSITGSMQAGIFASSGATVVENSVVGNGGDGILCNDCVAIGNQIHGNTGAAIQTNFSGGYGGNTIEGTTTVSGAMSQIAPNMCNGDTTCP